MKGKLKGMSDTNHNNSSSVGGKALKSGIIYTLSAFLLKGIAFLTTPLFARFMSIAEMGAFSNLTSWAHILSVIVTLNMDSSVALAYFDYGDQIYQYLSSIVIAGSAVTAVFYALAVRFSENVTSWLGVTDYMLHAIFLYFLFSPAVLIVNAKCRIYLQYRQSVLTSLLPAVLSVFVSLAAVLGVRASGDMLKARVLGYYGVWIAYSVVIWLYLLLRGRRFCVEHVIFALPLSLPIILHSLANTVLGSSDQVMIKRICGAEDAGYYAVAYNCGLIVSVLWAAINQALSPWCFRMMHQEQYRIINRVARPIVILFSGLILIIILLAPELIYFMGGGSTYMEAVNVVPPVVVGYVAVALYTFYVNIEFYHKKQRQIMIATTIAATLNVVLNLVFIPLFGYIAAAYTTLTGYLALLLIHYFFVRRMGLHTIYDMRFNAALIGFMVVISIAVAMLYKVPLVRLSLLCGIVLWGGGILFVYRHECRRLLRERDFYGLFQLFHLTR